MQLGQQRSVLHSGRGEAGQPDVVATAVDLADAVVGGGGLVLPRRHFGQGLAVLPRLGDAVSVPGQLRRGHGR